MSSRRKIGAMDTQNPSSSGESPAAGSASSRALSDQAPLSAEEVRIVASLIEKEVTTPAYYPLSANALVNACNQKSCRDPVMQFDERTTVRLLESLRDRKLVWEVAGAETRTPKYKQRLTERFGFSPAQQAVLCELMLRGPQTVGELRSRAERMHPFASLDEVHAALQALAQHPAGAWVALLPRQAGRKEVRYAHLLSGAPVEPVVTEAVQPLVAVSPDAVRLTAVEQEVAALRTEVADLRQTLDALRKMLE
jgi:uncharacterized protein YceH (UPF0502 family)